MTAQIFLFALLIVGVAAACRAPAGSRIALSAVAPGDRDVDHPGAESPIPLRTRQAVAPAIETDRDHEKPIPLPSQLAKPPASAPDGDQDRPFGFGSATLGGPVRPYARAWR